MTVRAPVESSVESPCVRRCHLDPVTRSCTGCLRTLSEIGRWSGMSDEERRAVIADLAQRSRPPN